MRPNGTHTLFVPYLEGKMWYFLAEAEKQNDHGNQDDPKQNVFAKNVASAVHSVTPFFDTEMFFGSLLLYEGL